MPNHTAFDSAPQGEPQTNPYANMELRQSLGLDYWHSLLIYHDGVAYYWQIYNHNTGACIQAFGDFHLARISAKRAGQAFWKTIAAQQKGGA